MEVIGCPPLSVPTLHPRSYRMEPRQGKKRRNQSKELSPVRGQLEILLPQPEIDYCYLSTGYMFPRRDGIILGGTWDHDDWSLAPNPEQATAILESHKEIMKGLK